MHFCERAVKGVDAVLHLAANAAGMGTNHGGDNLTVYQANASMTTNLLISSIRADVRVFLFASTACVYPANEHPNVDASALKEEDAWPGGAPEPQAHYYGLEKLVSELLLQRSAHLNIRVPIARLNNVFGPRDAWNNGREKVPVALLRKALAIRLAGEGPGELEIWGDGTQKRSLLFIDDCVGAILALLASEYDGPVNIGSNQMVTINDLAETAVSVAGLKPGIDIMFRHQKDPNLVGARVRSSDNRLAQKVLCGWIPKVQLDEGIAQTGRWIQDEMEKMADGLGREERISILQSMLRSKIVSLEGKDIKVAILLPFTSCGSNPPSECLPQLKAFAKSLNRTTWRDTHLLGGQRFVVKVYIAINSDDTFLLGEDVQTNMNVAEAALASQNICNVAIQICTHPADHVCAIWREVARHAWKEGCDYFVLLENDAVLRHEGWIRDAHAEFARIAQRTDAPHGFGCVVFTDAGYPAMSAFPIIHRTHLDIFQGDIIPDISNGHDRNAFLHQLYGHWDCCGILGTRSSDEIIHHQSFDHLDTATAITEQWVFRHCPVVSRKPTVASESANVRHLPINGARTGSMDG
ncbi:hypothetical protein JVU11DRAFT_4061 [Chiua virens]|nr:hypothetical protein JVU11DRAFT_4061 [Chiua virens]